MRLAAAGMYGQVNKDPVCGLNVDESKAEAAGFASTFESKTYYFCSEECKQHFDKHPERFAENQADVKRDDREVAGAKPVEADTVRDIVSGKEVKISQAKAEGLSSDFGGKTYYFESYANNRKFDKNPERFINQSDGRTQPHSHDQENLASYGKPETAHGMAKDPVCGLMVATGSAKQSGRTSEYKGKTYYFDTDGCKQRFDKDPKRYFAGSVGEPFPEKYPNVTTDPNQLLRLRRDLHRSLTPWKPDDLSSEKLPEGVKFQEHKAYQQTPPAPQAPEVPQAPQNPQAPQPAPAPAAPQAQPVPQVPQAPQTTPVQPPVPPPGSPPAEGCQ